MIYDVSFIVEYHSRKGSITIVLLTCCLTCSYCRGSEKRDYQITTQSGES